MTSIFCRMWDFSFWMKLISKKSGSNPIPNAILIGFLREVGDSPNLPQCSLRWTSIFPNGILRVPQELPFFTSPSVASIRSFHLVRLQNCYTPWNQYGGPQNDGLEKAAPFRCGHFCIFLVSMLNFWGVTNIASENGWLEDDPCLFGDGVYFQGRTCC